MYLSVIRTHFALRLRQLRERWFGIAAPQLVVRAPIPRHWRAVAIVLILGVMLATAGWLYDAGRRVAGFNQEDSAREINSLREQVDALGKEVTHLRSIANTSESNLQIDRTTVDKLTEQIRVLEEEKTELKENLAVFESLAAGGGGNAGFSLGRLRIEPEAAPGKYRYRILASIYGADAKQEFKGNLQLQVIVQDAGGQRATIVLPRPGDPDAASFSVSFRAFRSLEGGFQIPADVTIKRVEARLLRDGAILASQSASL
jgi:hypothetical protein